MFNVPTDIKAGRAVTLLGHSYVKDARINVDHLTTLAARNVLTALLRKGVLYAYPDPYGRKTRAGNPQPVSLPPVILKAILAAEEIQDAPGAPTDVVVTNGNAQVSIAFTAGTAGTSATTDVEYSLDDGATWVSSEGTTSPIVVTSLTNGTEYLIHLRSVNAYGHGALSAQAAGHPATTSSAPLALVATPGDDQVSIAFNVPSNDGGAAIIEYQYSIDAGAWASTVPATSASPIVIDEGIANGVEASVRLRAVNAAGNGAASTAVVFTPPALVPDAPTALVATPAALAVSIAFVAPAMNGGTIVEYQHSFNDGVDWFGTTPDTVASPYAMAVPADDYTVVLRAVNSAGNGPASAPVTFTVPAA